MMEIFDKNRCNGQVGNCNVSVGRYNSITIYISQSTYKKLFTAMETNVTQYSTTHMF